MIKSISRDKVLRVGRAFLVLGIILLFPSSARFKLLGATWIFIGSLSLIVYNAEKFKYFKLLHRCLMSKGYIINFRKAKLISLLWCIGLFVINNFAWFYLLYLHIIPQWVFDTVGFVFSILLIPIVFSPDKTDHSLVESHTMQLINMMKIKGTK